MSSNILKTMKWYKYDVRDLSDDEYTKWYSLMDNEKKQRVDKFRFDDDKKRTVAGEMLARKAISEWCKVAPESITFGIKEHGKPYAKGLPVEFNISHSGDMVVCAVDDNPVGIDIEQIRPIDLTVAKRICTEEELIYLFSHAPTAEDFVYTTDTAVLNRFFELWTAKEAYGKYNGIGLINNNTDFIKDYIKIIRSDNYILSIYQYGIENNKSI